MKRDVYHAPYFFNVWVGLAVVCTFLNDHYFKSHVPIELNFLTGKLSDFCGLFFFPVFLVYVTHRFCKQKYDSPLIFWCCLVTTILYILFKYVDLFRNALIEFISRNFFFIHIVSDPTDLVALSSVVVAYFFLKKYQIT